MTYDLRLGPLRFPAPLENVGEGVSDSLEAVGAAVVAAERKPRPLKLKPAVHGEPTDVEEAEAGRRLRRQVRQLMGNAPVRLQGFYLVWTPDADLDCWLMVGSGELSETDPGVGFGEYDLTLNEAYVVGRPGTHRPGRRAALADRRGGLVPRDTRGTLYAIDNAAQAQPNTPLKLPGDIAGLVASGNAPVEASEAGYVKGGRTLWTNVKALDATILSYSPALSGRERFLELDEAGATRVWDLSKAGTYPPNPAAYTEANDADPTLYGWERVYGDITSADKPLAVENGVCRLIWLGAANTQGLAVEVWNPGLKHFQRIGRVLHAVGAKDGWVIETTNERSVLEWRAGRYAMRAILQRGWWGPRLESYDDGGGETRLEYAPEGGSGAVTTANMSPTWVKQIKQTGARSVNWATQKNSDAVGTTPTIISGSAATFSNSRVLVGQLAPEEAEGIGLNAGELASVSLTDARAVPVLIGRS